MISILLWTLFILAVFRVPFTRFFILKFIAFMFAGIAWLTNTFTGWVIIGIIIAIYRSVK